MSKKIILYLIVVLALPGFSFAAQLKFREVPNTKSYDNATVVEVSMDSDQKNINVVDGVIKVEGEGLGKIYVNPDTTGSVLTLWPTPPQYIETDSSLHFVGGVPNGWTGEAVILRLRLSARMSGKVNLSWSEGSAYLNDGKGTVENISTEPFSVAVKSIGDKSTIFYRQEWFLGAIIFLIFCFALFVIYGKKKNI